MSRSHTRRRRFPSDVRPSREELAREVGRYFVEIVEPVLHLLPPLLAFVVDCELGITRRACPRTETARRLGRTVQEYEQLLFRAVEAASALHAEHVGDDLPYAA